MYERILDKLENPSFDDMVQHCEKAGIYFSGLNNFLWEEYGTKSVIRFPYGNNYGWGVKHELKNKHICDIFAEKSSVTLMLRLPNKKFEEVYPLLSDYSKEICDNKYPCGSGGWIQYRILTEEHLWDAQKLLRLKFDK